MPDLVTHLATGYGAAIPFLKNSTARVFFLTGVLLPDLLSRPIYILVPGTYDAVAPLHTPVGYAIACWLLVQACADKGLRDTAFWYLLGGGGLHFALDALQRHIWDGYCWLFPFSRASYSWGLFWPEDSLNLLPFSVGFIVVVQVAMWISGRRQARRSATFIPSTCNSELQHEERLHAN